MSLKKSIEVFNVLFLAISTLAFVQGVSLFIFICLWSSSVAQAPYLSESKFSVYDPSGFFSFLCLSFNIFSVSPNSARYNLATYLSAVTSFLYLMLTAL